MPKARAWFPRSATSGNFSNRAACTFSRGGRQGADDHGRNRVIRHEPLGWQADYKFWKHQHWRGSQTKGVPQRPSIGDLRV